jgi:hypothetical protein
MSDHQIGPDLFTGIPDVPHRHGFARGDARPAGRAIVLIGDLARICAGSRDHPYGPAITPAPHLPPPEPPSPDPDPGPSVPEDDRDAVGLTHGQVRTVLTTLDIAAERKRDRAEMRTDSADQSCCACELRLRGARTYDQLARQLLHDEQAARTARRQPEPHAPPGLAADKELGQ